MAGLTETTSETEAGVQPFASARTQLAIDGMTCGNCARHVTEALQGVPGVRAATVNLDSHQATIRWAHDMPPDEAAVVEAVVKEGYGAQVIQGHTKGGSHHRSVWTLNLALGIPLTALLMLGEW